MLADVAEDPAALALAGVESDSEHPLARAIVEGARGRGVAIPTAAAFEPLAGRGARDRVDGHEVAVGGPRLLTELGLAPDPLAAVWDAAGPTVLHVVVDGAVSDVLALEDEIRPESGEAVDALHCLGVRVAMITDDARPVAEAVVEHMMTASRPERLPSGHENRLVRPGSRDGSVRQLCLCSSRTNVRDKLAEKSRASIRNRDVGARRIERGR